MRRGNLSCKKSKACPEFTEGSEVKSKVKIQKLTLSLPKGQNSACEYYLLPSIFHLLNYLTDKVPEHFAALTMSIIIYLSKGTTSQGMPHLISLRFQIALVMFVGVDLNRNILHDL